MRGAEGDRRGRSVTVDSVSAKVATGVKQLVSMLASFPGYTYVSLTLFC